MLIECSCTYFLVSILTFNYFDSLDFLYCNLISLGDFCFPGWYEFYFWCIISSAGIFIYFSPKAIGKIFLSQVRSACLAGQVLAVLKPLPASPQVGAEEMEAQGQAMQVVALEFQTLLQEEMMEWEVEV